jgi:membrane fusion protein (multidrug efflux system)
VTLYAKVSGYLKEIKADRGDKVRARQVLAVIESPELEQQYEAARADASYKRANARRAATLAGPGAVSVREAELERTSADVAEAQVSALQTQKGYTILRAPFAGTVTARFADPGALVQNAANAQSGALPVVTVSQLDRLRVFVYVDQRDAAFVHPGDEAEVVLPDGGVVAGRVARASGELEPHTRTMPLEVHLENQDGRIVAGSFVAVRLTLPSPPLLEIPARALVVREQKTLVAVVGPDNHLQLRPVVVARDDGDRIALRQGVSEGELVALDVGHSLTDGDLIQPVRLPAPTANHAPGN